MNELLTGKKDPHTELEEIVEILRAKLMDLGDYKDQTEETPDGQKEVVVKYESGGSKLIYHRKSENEPNFQLELANNDLLNITIDEKQSPSYVCETYSRKTRQKTNITTQKAEKQLNKFLRELSRIKKKKEEYRDDFQDRHEEQYDDLCVLYESLIKDNDENDSKHFILNMLVALMIGYKIPPLDLKQMYQLVKMVGFPVTKQPDVVVSDQTQKTLDTIMPKHDWSQTTPQFVSELPQYLMTVEERRSSGSHYTSRENIHKVIDPLFLDDLTERVGKIEETKDKEAAKALQKEMGSLKFLDPACGGGNFLVEAYMSLRRLENRLLKVRFGDLNGN